MGLFSNTKIIIIAAVFLVFVPLLVPKVSFASAFSQGDINSDDCVNANDSSLWLTNFRGTSGVADINTDQKVDVKDLAYIAKDYGPCKPRPVPSFQSQSPFGIEYGLEWHNIPGAPIALSEFWKNTGARWVKLNDVEWQDIEPVAPVNGVHTYVWNGDIAHGVFRQLDHDVSKETGLIVSDRPNWDANFNIVIELRAYSKWAQKPSNATNPLVTKQGRPPKDEYLQAYHDWVRAVVERYDDDGFQDGPDLTRGVSVYEIESEGSGDPNNIFYSATPAEYAVQLRTAYAAVKEADPNALVMLNGLNLRDLFADGSTTAQVEAKLNSLNYPNNPYYNAQAVLDAKTWMDQLLDATKGYFDIVENHELGSWRQMLGDYNWIRDELQAHGIDLNTVQIWAGDSVSASNLRYLSGIELDPSFGQELSVAGVPDTTAAKNTALWNIITSNNAIYNDLNCTLAVYVPTSAACANMNQTHLANDYAAYEKWYRRLQSEEVIKKFVYGMAVGYRVNEMGTLSNWPAYSGFQLNGFLDDNTTNPSLPGNPRPMWYAYQQMIQKIGTVTSVTRLDAGRSDYFLFQVNLASGAKVYVVWMDGGKDVVPTQVAPTPVYPTDLYSFSLSGGSRAVVTPTIVDRNQTTGQPVTLFPDGSGNVQITLSTIPLFIEVQ